MRTHVAFLGTLVLPSAFAACASPPPVQLSPVPGIKLPEWGSPAWNSTLSHLTDSLKALDPVHEASAALVRGDCHLLGLTYYALVVPELKDPQHYPYGVYVFPSSDYIRTTEQWNFQDAAAGYASHYNRTILSNQGSCKPLKATAGAA